MNKLNLISLYGGPGSGKSSTAAGLFFEMKAAGYKVELVTEYAKDKVYEGHLGCLEDQIYIFAKQQRRLNRLIGEVDWAITDSPLLLSILYNKDLSDNFNKVVLEQYNRYNNYNFYINRIKEYKSYGRTQTFNEAVELDYKMKQILYQYNIDHKIINGDYNAPRNILNIISSNLNPNQFNNEYQWDGK